jgi:hypothetical protein
MQTLQKIIGKHNSVPLITLTPWQYTAVASIGSGTPGVVLPEACEIP